MEAARIAAIRGHEVVLYEKNSYLGGSVPLAAIVKDLETDDMTRFVKYLSMQLEKEGVTVRLNTEVTQEIVKQHCPDVLVIAAGAAHTKFDLPGAGNPKVIQTEKLHGMLNFFLKFFSSAKIEKLSKLWIPVGRSVVVMDADESKRGFAMFNNEFVFAYFACQKIGAIPVLLIDRYRQFEIDRLLKLSGATAWIVPRRTRKFDYAPMIEAVIKDHPEVERVITVRGKMGPASFKSLEELIDENELTRETMSILDECRPDPRQVAHMGSTGGTTGEPKIVPRTHNSLACGVEFCSMAWDQHCEDVNMIVGPVGHDLSFSKGLLGSVITQGKLVFQDSTDTDDICRTIEKEKVAAIVWVPTLAQKMVQSKNIDRFDLASLRKMHSGGGASHREMVRELWIVSGYATTTDMAVRRG